MFDDSATLSPAKPTTLPLAHKVGEQFFSFTDMGYLGYFLFCISTRVFGLMSQFNDEKQLMSFHQNLEDVTEDQLSLASIHYMRSHYPEAIDIYKRLLLQNRDFWL
ncbi:hypothetical protein fugu_008410 [Takifugu bimaculatus]|uniref:Intraflagellar transport protein 56 n=1 Tax=Takifugu bimaculatus TaxID=433685 RepID=A0A4Z2B2V0_9TELE|nr:hypothetical protein fugu_008410 [Takifugu bimaculatus]